MTATPSRIIDKVGLCVLREGRLLLARSRGQDVFQIPGGKVEDTDADDIAALEREIREELGVEIDRTSAMFIGLFSAVAAGHVGVTVTVKLFEARFSGEPQPQSEIEELAWLDLATPDHISVSSVVQDRIAPFLLEREI